jgi:hypothetical protein
VWNCLGISASTRFLGLEIFAVGEYALGGLCGIG